MMQRELSIRRINKIFNKLELNIDQKKNYKNIKNVLINLKIKATVIISELEPEVEVKMRMYKRKFSQQKS